MLARAAARGRRAASSQLATELWKHAPLAELVHTPSPTVEACLVPAHAFDVCAFLANILVRGGAQSRGDHVTFRGAFEHAVAALMAVSANADAPAWPLALVSERAWCSFFCDIAWDATVILVDRPWITVLLATDSD